MTLRVWVRVRVRMGAVPVPVPVPVPEPEIRMAYRVRQTELRGLSFLPLQYMIDRTFNRFFRFNRHCRSPGKTMNTERFVDSAGSEDAEDDGSLDSRYVGI